VKTIKHILSIALLITAIATTGNAQPKNIDEQPYIEVTGTAEKEVIPDEIYIGITIHEKYMNKTKVSIEEQEEKLKAAVKTLGINLQNLYISDVTAGYVKVYWKTKDVITNKNYTLKVTDATTVGKVFQELDKLEINDARISKVSHSKLDSLKKEVRITAIKAAKEKADYLLLAIGEQAGKPLIVKETEPTYYATDNVFMRNSNVSYGMSNYVDLKTKGEENNDIEFQKIRITTSTYIKFAIK
jgi:uncharacterized protein YggE